MTYQVKLSEDGKVSLPADIARALGLQPGDRLGVAADGKTLEIKTYAEVVREGQELFRSLLPKDFKGSLVDELIADRRAEAARE